MSFDRITASSGDAAMVQAEQPFSRPCNLVPGVGACQQDRAEQGTLRPARQQKAILRHPCDGLRNYKAPGPESVTPECLEGLKQGSALIVLVKLTEQSPVLGRKTIAFVDDQLKLNAAPLAGKQPAEKYTGLEQLRVGLEPLGQDARQCGRQPLLVKQRCEPRQIMVARKLGEFQRNSPTVCQ